MIRTELFGSRGIGKPSNFRLRGDEKLGDSLARVISYSVRLKDSTYALVIPVKVILWLDPNTNLPLQRVAVLRKGNEEITIKETYEDITLDKQIAPAKFHPPRKK